MADTTLKATLIGQDRSMSRTFDQAGKSADQAGNRVSKMGGALAAVGKAGLAAGAVAAVGLGKSIQKAMDYDKTMRLVGATLGTTGTQQKALSALALKMGADTVFSAKDASDAMLNLAKGGMTAAQIQGGALAATMTLAAAGELEMGSAATYVGNALNTFGLRAKDAGAVAAALAGGANASSASVESLGQALSQVGPGARTAGVSLQTTVGILSAFDNAGIKGSDAGTSFKTMLTRLVPSTDAAASAMRKLGLDFTDAQGNFLPMRDVAEQLRVKLKGLSEEQRSQALTTIFGSDATRAATVLSQLGAAGVDKYTKATSDQAAAQRMANEQMKGASGAWEAFKGSVETLAISLGIRLLPMFTRVVEGITSIVNAIAVHAGPTLDRFGKWFTASGTPALASFGAVIRDQVLPRVREFASWVKNDLWPALQRGAAIVLPALRKAWADLTGGVGNSGIKWREIGRFITGTFIPIAAKVAAVYIPAMVRQFQIIAGVIRVVWTAFVAWRNVVLGVVQVILGRFAALASGIASFLRGLSKIPGFGWAASAAAKMENAASAARRLASNISAIRSKTVNVHVRFSSSGRQVSTGGGRVIAGGLTRHGGGPVHKGSTYLVGEHGPELLTAGQTGHITPTRQTQAMLRSDPRNGWGQGNHDDRPIVVQLMLDGRMVQEVLLKRKKSTGMALGLA